MGKIDLGMGTTVGVNYDFTDIHFSVFFVLVCQLLYGAF